MSKKAEQLRGELERNRRVFQALRYQRGSLLQFCMIFIFVIALCCPALRGTHKEAKRLAHFQHLTSPGASRPSAFSASVHRPCSFSTTARPFMLTSMCGWSSPAFLPSHPDEAAQLLLALLLKHSSKVADAAEHVWMVRPQCALTSCHYIPMKLLIFCPLAMLLKDSGEAELRTCKLLLSCPQTKNTQGFA